MKKFKHLCLILAIILISACSVFSNALQVTATSSPAVKTTPYYLSENSNVDTIHATTVGALPCIGEAKIIVFYTDFKGGDTNWTKSPEEVENMFFSEVGKNDPSVAYTSEDSLRSYYYRSSYGKVDITGSVFEYQTQNHTSYYTSLDIVLDEIIEYASKFFTLKVGDLIFTGTPAGVGKVSVGDRLEGYIEDRKLIDFEIA